MARVRKSPTPSADTFGSLLDWPNQDGQPGERLAVVPIRDAVFFPGMSFSLLLGRERSIMALESTLERGGRRLVLATQRRLEEEDPQFDAIHRVGVVVEVTSTGRLPDGMMRMNVESCARVRIEEWCQSDPCMTALVRPFAGDDVDESEPETVALSRTMLTLFEELIGEGRSIPPEALAAVTASRNPVRMADLVLSYLSLPIERKQRLLEEPHQQARLKDVVAVLYDELRIVEIQRDIRQRVERDAGEDQRTFLLREQLKAIQEELGEGDSDSLELLEMRRRIQESDMPEAAAAVARREVDRLGRMGAGSPESTVVRNYVECLLDIPWGNKTGTAIDLEIAERILEQGHHGLQDAKERILDYIAVRKLAGTDLRSPVLCFEGPPGVGKTSLGRSVAKALGRRFVRISLGGVDDEAEIRGHRRTYLGAMPGRLIQGLKQAGTMDPVILLDEIDKMGSDRRGDPAAALLEALDPEQNSHFVDHYLDLPVDLSNVVFLATANLVDRLSPALRDRLEVIGFSGYVEREKLVIAKQHLLPRQLRAHGLSEEWVDFEDDALEALVREYTREAGVRHLERQIGTLCRKTARGIAAGHTGRIRWDRGHLVGNLGRPAYRHGTIESSDPVGAATGLVYTESGGDTVMVEVQVVPTLVGEGKLLLTGHLGEVMRESAQAAWTFVRSRRDTLHGFPANPGLGQDIHVHVPNGAVPKDGPSAGVTIAVALASAVMGTPVRREVAMTGEITLRGRVLAVGGIKEKVLAAHRAGIRTVILPEENLGDLREVPEDVVAAMDFRGVSHADQVLELALARPARDTSPPTGVPSTGRRKSPAGVSIAR